jgi:hypothetical protein
MDAEARHTAFTIYHQDDRILVGYVFSRTSNPWIADWQENGSKKQMPWNGRAVARGLLVGTSSFIPEVKYRARTCFWGLAPCLDWCGREKKAIVFDLSRCS